MVDSTDAKARAPLSVRLVYREASDTARGRFWEVVTPALVIFVPLTLIDTYAEHLAAEREGDTSLLGTLIQTFSLAGASGLLFGWVVFAGLLDAEVGSHHFGRERMTLGQRLRHLPLRRLIAANIIVSAIVVVGATFLVIPGLVALTLFGIVGPVIVSERLGVFAALRRSAHLVRRHLWVAFGAIALPFLAEQLIEDGMLTIWPSNIWESALVSIALTLIVGVAVALVEVVLAYELITREEPAAARSPLSTLPPASSGGMTGVE